MSKVIIPLNQDQLDRLAAGKRLTVHFTPAGRVGLKQKLRESMAAKAPKAEAVEFAVPTNHVKDFISDVKHLNAELRQAGEKRSNLKKLSTYGQRVKFTVKRTYPKLTRLIEKYGEITAGV